MSDFKFGSKERELDRTAEMVLDLCRRGQVHSAIWLIHDSNRHDTESMKFLAQRVQYRETGT